MNLSLSGNDSAVRFRRQQRDRRVLIVTLSVCCSLALIAFAVSYGPAYQAYWSYTPREGDLLFQSLPHSRLVNAIEGVTESPYSHCGIVAQRQGQWVVYEAFRSVEASSLKEVIFRGRNQGFAIYRLVPEKRSHVPAMIRNLQEYLGRPYDVRYRMDDESLYCTELIFKAYQRATGGEALGTMVRFGDMNWRPHRETIEFFEQGPVPVDREMITPRHMAQAPQLELVFSYNIQSTP